jgi:hypothetical protein
MERETYDNYQLQSELQKEASEAQMNAYAPQMHEQLNQGRAVLMEQTNPKKVVHEIILRLKGIEQMPNGVEKKTGDPKLNKVGIENMKYLLDSYINQNTILSNLDGPQISKIMIQISGNLIDDLTLNWKAYGISNKTDLDTIADTILINVYLSLYRAYLQGEKKFHQTMTVESLSSGSRMAPPKKEGFWSRFKL